LIFNKAAAYSHRAAVKNKAFKISWSVIRAVIIFGLCFDILYPFFVKSMTMLMSQNDLVDATVNLFPREFSMYYIRATYRAMNYLSSAANTFFVAITTSLLQLIVCTAAGYGFARFKFKGRGLFFAFVLLALLIPPQVYATPLYLYFRFFGVQEIAYIKLTDGILPYFILSLTGLGLRNGLYIFLMSQFFKGMPHELEEAAYIDGYGPVKTFFKIMLPNTMNMMIAVFVLSFSWQWTDVFYSNLF